MANHKTGAQRYNDKMDKIFKRSEELGNHTLHGSTEKPDHRSEAMKKSMAKKMTKKKELDPDFKEMLRGMGGLYS